MARGGAIKRNGRRLRLWNGHVFFYRVRYEEGDRERRQFHANVCAYSQKDAVALLEEFGMHESLYHFRGYWSPCWGDSMDEVEPERGVWIEFERSQSPVKIKAGHTYSVSGEDLGKEE